MAAMLLAMGALPATEAVPPDVEVGVAADDAKLEKVTSGARAQRLTEAGLTRGALKGLDVLVLDAAVLESAWASKAKRDLLHDFLADHRAIVVEGGQDKFDRFTNVKFPRGTDQPETEDGRSLPVAAVAHGAYRTETGEWAFATFEYGTVADYRDFVAEDASRWIRDLPDFQHRAGKDLRARAADDSNWQSWGSVSYSYTWNPYGKIAYSARIYYAFTDGSDAWDWWNVEMTQTSSPGTYLWGNDWRTSMGWVTGDMVKYVASNQLSDYGPGTTDSSGSTRTLNFEVGMRLDTDGAPKTSTQSFGYTVEDMLVTQSSNPSTEYLYVRHEFGYDSGPANGLWSNKPAFTVRVNEGGCMKIPWQNKVEWRDYVANSYYTTWINSWREVCK